MVEEKEERRVSYGEMIMPVMEGRKEVEEEEEGVSVEGGCERG